MATRPTAWRAVPLLLMGIAIGIAGSTIVTFSLRYPGDDLTPWLEASRALTLGEPLYENERFLYPPSAALLGAPLAIVGDFEARIIVRLILGFSVLLGTIAASRAVGNPVDSWPTAVAALVVVCSPPFQWGLLLGNLGLGLVLPFALSLLFAVRRQQIWLGLALGLSLALKPVLAPLLVLLLFTRQWKALAVGLALPLVLSLVGLAWSVDGMRFVTDAVPFLLAGQDEYTRDANSSILGLALKYELVGASVTIARFLVTAVALVGAWLLLRSRQPRSVRLNDSASLLLLAGFLASSVSFDHYALFLVPLAIASAIGRSHALPALLWPGLAIIFLAFPLPNVLDRYWTPGEFAFLVYVLCLLSILVGGLLMSRVKEPDDPAGSPSHDQDAPSRHRRDDMTLESRSQREEG